MLHVLGVQSCHIMTPPDRFSRPFVIKHLLPTASIQMCRLSPRRYNGPQNRPSGAKVASEHVPPSSQNAVLKPTFDPKAARSAQWSQLFMIPYAFWYPPGLVFNISETNLQRTCKTTSETCNNERSTRNSILRNDISAIHNKLQTSDKNRQEPYR